ncbi:replication initiation factor domain-containing protein [Stratiformator vulcanicus]|uniref:Replication initiation factor n=1 Tax=Stratiformator vulcanicus TaxID=2527980 RepID=A0A517R651_9PLAN|nr:replication initiation factor domain-containing protein [Stratiformator vulcanicus]QDT39374.1 Replication initiation factor [Stratiformator vulcanicus]
MQFDNHGEPERPLDVKGSARSGDTGGEPGSPQRAEQSESLEGMASPVTRHAPISGPEDWEFLGANVDSLDLGVFVDWGEGWDQFSAELAEAKEAAAGRKDVRFRTDDCLMLPKGKAPAYQWHLQYREFHLFIGKSGQPRNASPNVFVSINARALWQFGMDSMVDTIATVIRELGGKVLLVKPSRVDLAADFRISAGLSEAFLQASRVPQRGKNESYRDGNTLETFYLGQRGAPKMLRIYDKALEVAKSEKTWMSDIWDLEECRDVWRVEFQVRRPFLKERGINSIDDLRENLGGMWQYLTTDFFSLRLRDNPNVSRCSMHPFWSDVQRAAGKFGEVHSLARIEQESIADANWYVAHIAGCLLGYAVRRRKPTLDAALKDVARGVIRYWRKRDFEGEYRNRSIRDGYRGDDDFKMAA